MAQAKPTISDFLPAPHQWSVEPSVREMLNILEQHLLDEADPVLRQSRYTTVSAIDQVKWPLSLICAAIGRKHPDRERISDAYEQLADLRERLHGMPRDRVSARMGEIAGLLAVQVSEPRHDRA